MPPGLTCKEVVDNSACSVPWTSKSIVLVLAVTVVCVGDAPAIIVFAPATAFDTSKST